MRDHRSEAGAILVWTALLLTVLIALAALGLDWAGALMTKNQALAASEDAGIAALRELWPHDYDPSPYEVGVVPDWSGAARRTELRAVARAQAALHAVGYRLEVFDRDRGLPVSPDDAETRTVVVQPEEPADARHGYAYVPDVQPNEKNDPEGDILLGTWSDDAFLPAGSTDVPQALEVVIRRSPDPRVPGIREGENPIPFTFGRATFLRASDRDGAPLPDPLLRNRGIGVRGVVRVGLVPAAWMPAGAPVEDSDKVPGRSGVLPLALSRPAFEALLEGDAPAVPRDFEIGGSAGEAFFVEWGGRTCGEMIEFLGGLREDGAPPALGVGDSPGSASTDPAEDSLRLESLEGCTWILPVIEAGAVLGFARVYAVAVEPAARRVTLAAAPSATTRHGGLKGTTSRSSAAATFFYHDAGGVARRARAFGVACVAAPLRFVERGGDP